MESSGSSEIRNFSIVGGNRNSTYQWYADGIREVMLANDYQFCEAPEPDTRVVFNLVDFKRPRPYRRKAQATFVVTVAIVDGWPENVFREGYTTLVRALSNMVVFIVRSAGKLHAHFVTLEGGCYSIDHTIGTDDNFFGRTYDRLAPLASSHLVINNEFDPDLSPELWEGDAVTEQMYRAGHKLDEMNLLPAMWPLHELLRPRDFEQVKRLYGIGGLSHGNLSARKDDTRFWMSASGVNKGNLREIGRDLLLVKGYDVERGVMLLSVPPGTQPRRVSVDCIEHWMIYTEHPEVGAIIHVHAWIDGIPSTEINFPCGTRELAKAVSDLVRQEPDPSRAIVGLKNHGMTITGHDLDEIFRRIDGRVKNEVPMS